MEETMGSNNGQRLHGRSAVNAIEDINLDKNSKPDRLVRNQNNARFLEVNGQGIP